MDCFSLGGMVESTLNSWEEAPWPKENILHENPGFAVIKDGFPVTEGHLLFVIPEVVREFDVKIYISAPEELRLERRLERDVRERGRTPESVRTQFAATVSPMHSEYIEPSSLSADLILEGSVPVEESLEKMLKFIAEKSR